MLLHIGVRAEGILEISVAQVRTLRPVESAYEFLVCLGDSGHYLLLH